VIVLLASGAGPEVARAVEAVLTQGGAGSRRVAAHDRLAVEVVAQTPIDRETLDRLAALPGVEAVLHAADPTPRVSGAEATVRVGPIVVGGGAFTLALGPCAVDREDDLDRIAEAARLAGARLLRGGAHKPRTSPYSFQGLGSPGLEQLRRAADRHGLALVTEVLSERSVDEVAAYAELLQIGARSMAHTPLLKAVARAGRPVLLKRGFGATVDEWLLAAEYLLDGGAPGVILCERGIRTFEPGTRATLDIGGLALARLRTRLPLFADPSHAAGSRALVEPLGRAA
jgi:3-deoxy-7-phosphoheptulonate synthase